MLSNLSQAFPADKGFFELSIVKNTLLTLSTLSFIACIFICSNSNLKFDLTYEGFNNFFTIFKFPIGLLSLSVPLLAVYAANHRSEQTRVQIAHISSQNTFKNYFDHLDNFDKYLSKEITDDSLFSVSSNRKLHRTIYSNAHTGDLSICTSFLNKVNQYYDLIDKLGNGLKSEHPEAQGTWAEAYISIYDASQKLVELLHLKTQHFKDELTPIDLSNGQTVAFPLKGNLPELLKLVIQLTKTLNQILLFDPKYSTPYYISLILEIDISHYGEPLQKINPATGELIDTPFQPIQFTQTLYDPKCPLGMQ